MNNPSASVIIPNRDRPRALECRLNALAEQMMHAVFFEVIVVDDGSARPLSLDPSRWSCKFQLKLIHRQNTRPAVARNRGVAKARGEVIAFTDDDCLATPGWLGELVQTPRKSRGHGRRVHLQRAQERRIGRNKPVRSGAGL
jgi:glycosyltransferase involved in cell wall biosynthesis